MTTTLVQQQPVPGGAPAPALIPPRPAALLAPYLVAVACTACSAFAVYVAARRSIPFDLTGHVEGLLPLTRLGMLVAPLIVAFRALVAALTAWLVIGALNERATMRTVAAAVLMYLPLLEVPALIDAVRMLLTPENSWASSHVPLGLEIFTTEASVGIRMLAQGLNVVQVVFTVLVARRMSHSLARGSAVAVPAAIAASVVLIVLPLLRQ